MAYNSKDTAAFKGVWVFCEQRDGVILGTGYQLLRPDGIKVPRDPGAGLHRPTAPASLFREELAEPRN